MIDFVYWNKIYRLENSENVLSVYQEDGTLICSKTVSDWKKDDDSFSKLVVMVNNAFFN